MSADPTTGDPASIRSLATSLQNDAKDIRSAAKKVTTEAGKATDAVWSGSAKGGFVSTATQVTSSAERTATHVDNTVSVLLDYATRVEQIQQDAQTIKSQQLRNDQDIASNARQAEKLAQSDDDNSGLQSAMVAGQATSLRATKAALEQSWQELISRRKAADADAASKLATTDVVGAIPPSSATIKGMSDQQLFDFLKGLKPEEVAALAGDKALADRLAGVNDPEAVAKWWAGLGGDQGKGSYDDHSALQDAFVAAFPAVIGNLNGAAYWARDTANRAELARQKKASDERLAHLQDQVNAAISAGLRPYDLETALEAERDLNGKLENFASAARGSQLPKSGQWRNVPVQVLSFTMGNPPLGAIALGNMDTAANVSYVVPGMATSMGDSTVLQRGVRNLKAAQNEVTGDPSATAVVAWINYDTPANFTVDPSQVLHDDKADAGARQLAADLSGFRATRGQAPALNVVGHSYGTTTASITLAAQDNLNVQSFVNLGSAGIPTWIHGTGDIHAQHVYAGTGDESTAPWGRYLSGRTDPSTGGFGAKDLPTGTEALPVPGGGAGPYKVLHGVTVHDPVKHRGDGDPYGYLDADTSSVANTAAATLNPW